MSGHWGVSTDLLSSVELPKSAVAPCNCLAVPLAGVTACSAPVRIAGGSFGCCLLGRGPAFFLFFYFFLFFQFFYFIIFFFFFFTIPPRFECSAANSPNPRSPRGGGGGTYDKTFQRATSPVRYGAGGSTSAGATSPYAPSRTYGGSSSGSRYEDNIRGGGGGMPMLSRSGNACHSGSLPASLQW